MGSLYLHFGILSRMIQIKDKQFKPYLEAHQLKERIKALGQQLSEDYKGKEPLVIGVLNGAFVFLADLVRELDIPAEVTFIRVSSYEEMQTTGRVKEVMGLQENIFGRDVIFVEDIVDTGNTLNYLMHHFRELGAKSLEVVTLLFKPDAFSHQFPLKYVGFEIPPLFVVGYGLDYDGHGRQLPDLYQLAEKS